jgi:hypothetical protein
MDFDIAPYAEIQTSLKQSGISCGVNGRHQITVSVQDHEIWPDAGNSFWITCASGDWHLFTWTPVGYQIPSGTDIAELCRRCIAVGERAMYRVPDDILDEFRLTEMDDDEADSVFAEMQTAK